MLFWEKIIREETAGSNPLPVGRCMARLLVEDPELRAFQAMAPAVQERERLFIGNSVRGYLGFLGAEDE